LRLVGTTHEVSGTPWLAIREAKPMQTLATGEEALLHRDKLNVRVINPFAHPRTLISDFTCAEVVLKGFFKKLASGLSGLARAFQISPIFIIHPCIEPEGGFTQVELRALHELCLGAGAARVKIWQGRELTDEELSSGNFPADGKLLN